ncbi:peptidylprolyl isomerase [Halomonas sp. ZH2S]|uniref:Peptidylprolyl isomerase n=1 Tax=Vreelandella zhuhanensis TaxID=2684210 RepID=A0A7X3H2C9_9GAMM|nr:SurA N-terminal domain-containing protein [Halomonas zhuhanensis]MWJ29257.1 peptidylprolyl isomerase [Halomonas zhuhanensis]
MNKRNPLMCSTKITTLGRVLGLALCLGIAPITLQAQDFQSTERRVLDRIVAVVDDRAIMQSELDDRLQQVLRQAEGQGASLPSRPALREQVLERMVIEEIQLQKAREANFSVDETELNQQVRRIAESNGMSLDEFADALEADGSSLADVREDIRREMLIRQVQQRQVGGRVSVTERDVERALEQYRQDASQEVQREQVRQALFQRRANEALENWHQEIRSQAFVDIRL